MPVIGKLSALQVKHAGPGKYGDGGGLWLYVRRSGSRSWVFRYTWRGKERSMGLGPWPDVGLARARELAQEARQLLRNGVDPISYRRTQTKKVPTFRVCAERYLRSHAPGWSNAKTPKHWRGSLERHVFPYVGDMPVNAIETAHVVEVLKRLWFDRPEMGSRVRGRMERILSWAAVQGYRDPLNPARWRGHLDQLLPAPTKVRRVEHYKHIPYQELPGVLKRIRTMPGIAPAIHGPDRGTRNRGTAGGVVRDRPGERPVDHPRPEDEGGEGTQGAAVQAGRGAAQGHATSCRQR
ncbi:MAG: DUF4102 domain-containing protein [Acidobacteria bacterium]|nr:DUF4102 domain-containing protein [Acidobacteriota bacterium]